MKNLALKFTDNLDLEFASAPDRAIAFVIDYVISFIFYILIYYLISDNKHLLGSLNILPLLVYKIIIESLTGTSIGKRMMNLVLINYSYQSPSFGQIIRRYALYIGLAVLASSYYLMFYIEFSRIYMISNFPEKMLQNVGIILSKYIIYLFAFVDLLSINKDPQNQNRALHDRIGKTLVVKVKKKTN